MFSSLNSANSEWRRVAEDTGIVGKEVILDEKGNTKSKMIAGKTQTNLLRKQNISVVASGKI